MVLLACPGHPRSHRARPDVLADAQHRLPLRGAVQTGTTGEIVFASTNGDGTGYQVLVVGPGVTGEVVPPKTAAGAKPMARVETRVRFTVAAGAPTGIRDVRLLTLARGVPRRSVKSSSKCDPVVREKNPNGSMKEAQAVALPAALCGAIETKVDVDFYKFNVKATPACCQVFHMYCQRPAEQADDTLATHARPMIALRNAAGTVLAANDHFFDADPLLHYRFTTAGEYYLEVRDVRYDGNRFWDYVIEAHERPFVTTISPACLPPGVPTRVRLIGFNLPADPFVTVTLPADAPNWDQWLQPARPGGAAFSMPCWIRPSALAGRSRSGGAERYVRSGPGRHPCRRRWARASSSRGGDADC